MKPKDVGVSAPDQPPRSPETVPARPRRQEPRKSLEELAADLSGQHEITTEARERQTAKMECQTATHFIKELSAVVAELTRDPFSGYEEERESMKGRHEPFPEVRRMMDAEYEYGWERLYRTIVDIAHSQTVSRTHLTISPELSAEPAPHEQNWQMTRQRARRLIEQIMRQEAQILSYLQDLSQRIHGNPDQFLLRKSERLDETDPDFLRHAHSFFRCIQKYLNDWLKELNSP